MTTIWPRSAALAITVLLLVGASSLPAAAGDWKSGQSRGADRGAVASASNAGANQKLGGIGLIIGLGILRNFIGNIARGGPGEGATPHISPTSDWKGQVNTNICNFKYICQK